jgi:hypothetical protein
MVNSTIAPDEARLRRLVSGAGAKNPLSHYYGGAVGIDDLKKEYAAAGFSTEVMVVDTVDAHTRFVGQLLPGRSYGTSTAAVRRITDKYRQVWPQLPWGAVYAFKLR